MTFLPSVVEAEHRGGYRLRLVFNDGSEKTVDFAEWLDGPMFEPLRAPDFFARYFLDGRTVVWPNGADIAPETLYAVPGRRRPNRRWQPTKAPRRRSTTTTTRKRLRG
jgi:hypothetical protein